MTREQFLLLKLAEECMEVAQRCSKQIQFGSLEVQNTDSHQSQLTNAERTKQELLDLFSLVTMLWERKYLPEIEFVEFEIAKTKKQDKLQKYLDYSAQLGILPEIKL